MIVISNRDSSTSDIREKHKTSAVFMLATCQQPLPKIEVLN